jgi:TPR repeat protein
LSDVWLRLRSLIGSSSAQLQLAHNYWRGEYGEPSLGQAIAWASRSADRGNKTALVFLGNLFTFRSGPGDLERAARAFGSAASLGSIDGMYSLGICY